MSETIYDFIASCSSYLKLDVSSERIAQYAQQNSLTDHDLEVIRELFDYLKQQKEAVVVSTQLKMSHLPLKVPKTFDNFDFDYLHVRGRDANALKNLRTLSALYAKTNLAFIGPPGVGKTHLAMAFGRACCEKGMKVTFLKATELRDKFRSAINAGRQGSYVSSLVKPACLIIDEIGRCQFDEESTRMLFDVIDRRYNKDSPNMMIFTSNKEASKWAEYFEGDDTLLCALDRAFDSATVFVMRGVGYRGRRLETIAVDAGPSASVVSK